MRLRLKQLPEEENPTIAKRGVRYPIRLFHMSNDILIIGMIIHMTDSTTHILRPYVVSIEVDQDDDIKAYELIPYGDQLADGDPLTMNTVAFLNTSLISVMMPAEHLINTYQAHTSSRVAVATDQDLYDPPEQPNESTLH